MNLSKAAARGIALLPVLGLVFCIGAPVAVAMSTRAPEEIHEADKPALVERDEPVAVTYQPHATNLGEFTLTAYCACPLCCGKSYDDPEYGITATGTVATQGRTIAVDPEVIPLGSVLYINGERYIAEDVGGLIQGDIIDIYFDSHEKALEFGRQASDVYIFR